MQSKYNKYLNKLNKQFGGVVNCKFTIRKSIKRFFINNDEFREHTFFKTRGAGGGAGGGDNEDIIIDIINDKENVDETKRFLSIIREIIFKNKNQFSIKVKKIDNTIIHFDSSKVTLDVPSYDKAFSSFKEFIIDRNEYIDLSTDDFPSIITDKFNIDVNLTKVTTVSDIIIKTIFDTGNGAKSMISKRLADEMKDKSSPEDKAIINIRPLYGYPTNFDIYNKILRNLLGNDPAKNAIITAHLINHVVPGTQNPYPSYSSGGDQNIYPTNIPLKDLENQLNEVFDALELSDEDKKQNLLVFQATLFKFSGVGGKPIFVYDQLTLPIILDVFEEDTKLKYKFNVSIVEDLDKSGCDLLVSYDDIMRLSRYGLYLGSNQLISLINVTKIDLERKIKTNENLKAIYQSKFILNPTPANLGAVNAFDGILKQLQGQLVDIYITNKLPAYRIR
jgi:hypothetical protein